jgi:single-stranded DNA-binding protein
MCRFFFAALIFSTPYSWRVQSSKVEFVMSINHGVLSGNLVRDPVSVGRDTPIALMTVASNRNADRVDYIEFKAVGKMAETLLQNVGKGDKVTFSYRLESYQFKDQQTGQNQFRQEAVIQKAEF